MERESREPAERGRRRLFLEELEPRVMLNGHAVATVTEGDPLTFTDADGDEVTVTVTGPGQIDIEFTGPTQDGSDIATAQISGGGGSSDFDFSYTGAGNGVQVTGQLAVDPAFDTVEVAGDVADLAVNGDIASRIDIAGALGGGAVTGSVRGRLNVGELDGDLTVEGAVPGRIEVAGDAGGGIYVEGGDIHRLEVGGTLAAPVVSADDIDSLIMGDADGALVLAGFSYDPVTETLTPTGFRGDIRGLVLTAGGMTETDVVASDDILYSDGSGTPGRLSAAAGGALEDVGFFAGLGPGADGEFFTGDDVILNDGRIGNIGSASTRFTAVSGDFVASGRIYDINSAGDLNASEGVVWALDGDIDDLRAGGTLGGFVVAGDDIDSITAGDITGAVITAGFDVDPETILFSYAGGRGDIRRITLTASDITDSTIVASDDLLYTGHPLRLAAHDGAVISDSYFSAGFGPGADGEFFTADDAPVNDGRIGNIGSNAHRFASITGTFQAAGRLYDLNSVGDIGADETDYHIWSMGDIDDLRAGGTLYTLVLAGDDIDSITAGEIDCSVVSAGYDPDWSADHLVPSGFSGDLRRIHLLNGGITDTTFFVSDDILYTDHALTLEAPAGAVIDDSDFLAGIDPGPDGEFGTADDAPLGDARIGNIGSTAHRFAAIDASFIAAGRLYDVNSAGDLGDTDGEDLIYSFHDIDDLRAGGTLRARVVAGDDIDSILAGSIDTEFVAAGFDYDVDSETLSPSGMMGDIRHVSLLGGDITDTTIAASDDILYTSSAQRLTVTGGESITGSLFSAGFGPGPDDAFGTTDDVVLSLDGRIGNIGSADQRPAVVAASFQATGRLYDINSDGDLGTAEDFIWSMGDIDDLRAGGALRAFVAAGDDIDTITAGSVEDTLISAGFDPGPNGTFDPGFEDPTDDVASGFFGTLGHLTTNDGDITGTLVRTTGRIGSVFASHGSINDSLLSAGFAPGADGLFGTDDDTIEFSADIVSVAATDPAGGIASSIYASDIIYQLGTSGVMGTAGDELWAENIIVGIYSVGEVGFDTIGTNGYIGLISVDEPDDTDLADPGLLSDIFAPLGVATVALESASFDGTLLPPTTITDLILDTDGDGV